MKTILIATAAVLIVTPAIAGGFNPKTGEYHLPPPKITTEKNIPAYFYGEWCYANDYVDNNGRDAVDYRLPSWSDPGMCDKKEKLLDISEQEVSAEGINCVLTSKVKVIVIVIVYCALDRTPFRPDR